MITLIPLIPVKNTNLLEIKCVDARMMHEN